MSNFTEKVEDKLHIGGHKKEGAAHPQHTEGAAHPQYTDPAYGGGGAPGHAGQATGVHPATGAPGAYGGQATGVPGAHVQAGQPQAHPHEGPLDKVKNKVKGGKSKGEGGSSSSSSESDGEGGRRRKKKLGIL